MSDHHAFQRVYSRRDNILMVPAPHQQQVLGPEVLAAVECLTQQAWQALSPADAVRYAFRTVDSALWITSLILMAGFALMALSPFQLNQHTGLLMAITIGFALLADFLLLPPLLLAVDRK